MHSLKNQKRRFIRTKRRSLSAVDMISRPFTQKELQLSQLRNEKLSPQIHFATLTLDHQIKPVQIFVRLENVLPPQKDDQHSISV